MTDLELMQLHVEAEFTHDAAADLVSTNEPAATTAPRFFLGHTALGTVCRFRREMSKACRLRLAAAVREATQDLSLLRTDRALDPTPFEHILSEEAPVLHTSVGLAYRFPRVLSAAPSTRILGDRADATVLHPLLAAWAPDIQLSPPLVACILDGVAVAVCGSVRMTARAHEAGVETAAPFRGRGYARAAVAAWAAAVRALDVEPLYSTTWQNTASRAVARRLGLVSVGRDLHIT